MCVSLVCVLSCMDELNASVTYVVSWKLFQKSCKEPKSSAATLVMRDKYPKAEILYNDQLHKAIEPSGRCLVMPSVKERLNITVSPIVWYS